MKKFIRTGNPYIWLTAGTPDHLPPDDLRISCTIMVNGFGIFWPRKVVRVTLYDGTVALEKLQTGVYPHQKGLFGRN
ncbi:MAG: hypothetical protein HS132_02445 [Planctomycetia bacterium]|nr:hypothetical protein [Planctomycetia bacterium]